MKVQSASLVSLESWRTVPVRVLKFSTLPVSAVSTMLSLGTSLRETGHPAADGARGQMQLRRSAAVVPRAADKRARDLNDACVLSASRKSSSLVHLGEIRKLDLVHGVWKASTICLITLSNGARSRLHKLSCGDTRIRAPDRHQV